MNNNATPTRLSVRLPGRLGAVHVTGVSGEASSTGGTQGQVVAQETTPDAQELTQEREGLLQATQALNDGVKKIHELQDQLMEDAEQQIVELAIGIAHKVLSQEIEEGHYDMEPILKEALLHIPPRKSIVCHMNLYDWANCKNFQQEQVEADNGIRFVADPSVRRGECVLETDEGFVESSMEGRLQEVGEALKSPE